MGCVEGFGAFEERSGGLFAFVAEYLGVRQSAVVIDGVVDEGVTATLLLVVAFTNCASEFAVPATVGNAAELFDVDVDQVARRGMFIAARLRPVHSQAGVLVQVPQQRHLVPVQDRTDGAAR